MPDLLTVVGALAVVALWDAWRRYLGRNRADMTRELAALRENIDSRAYGSDMLALHKRLEDHDTEIRRLDTAIMDARRVAGNTSAAVALSGNRPRRIQR